MRVRDIFRKHTVKHKGKRKGETTDVILRPYEKNGAYRVAKTGDGNTVEAEIPCRDLDEVAEYVEQGGYRVRMKSTRPKVEGLYAADEIEVIR